MAHVIELWAPWMPADEAAAYVKHVWDSTAMERIQTAKSWAVECALLTRNVNV